MFLNASLIGSFISLGAVGDVILIDFYISPTKKKSVASSMAIVGTNSDNYTLQSTDFKDIYVKSNNTVINRMLNHDTQIQNTNLSNVLLGLVSSLFEDVWCYGILAFTRRKRQNHRVLQDRLSSSSRFWQVRIALGVTQNRYKYKMKKEISKSK